MSRLLTPRAQQPSAVSPCCPMFAYHIYFIFVRTWYLIGTLHTRQPIKNLNHKSVFVSKLNFNVNRRLVFTDPRFISLRQTRLLDIGKRDLALDCYTAPAFFFFLISALDPNWTPVTWGVFSQRPREWQQSSPGVTGRRKMTQWSPRESTPVLDKREYSWSYSVLL